METNQVNNQNQISSIKVLNKRRKEPPTEIRLFKFGENKTTKGVFTLTRENAEKIMEIQAEYKNKLNIDYNHAQLTSEDPDTNISAGKYDLALKNDGLYAVNIEYTDKARNFIINNEYLYISPAFSVDKENNIVSIINFALTNIPASYDLKELMAASKVEIQEIKNSKTNNCKSVEVEKMNTEQITEQIEQEEVLLADPAPSSEDQGAPSDVPDEKIDISLQDVMKMLEVLGAKLDSLMDKGLDITDESDVSEESDENLSDETDESLSISDASDESDKSEVSDASERVDVISEASLEEKLSALSIENESLKKEILLSSGIQAGYILPSHKEIWKKLSLSDLESSISDLKKNKVSDKINIEIKSPSPSFQSDHDFLVQKYKKIFS